MSPPTRLQLSRRKGFDLQAWSMETNGLPAVNVARPSRFGNPFTVINEEGWPLIEGPDGEVMNGIAEEILGEQLYWANEQQARVELFRLRHVDRLPNLAPLRGKNLACWCKPGAPCHADVLLELANRPAGLADANHNQIDEAEHG
ncbi:MAG: DUF4326 domain-containing protein [Bosea sp.]|nr:DUF4326 domain-containing protein [Bosea sp. (in: a-proteobacteria)]MBN9453293.1 DUF4326 domain-containing protein [Bosea sp. (in: a-proteobacteria)]